MNITRISRRTALAASTFALAAVGVFSAMPAQASPATSHNATPAASASWRHQTPSQVLASTPWETTNAVDQDGNRVALDNPAVSSFVGWAYFKADGTYTMYNLDDTPKLHGDWTVTPSGSQRWINAKDADGNVLFERVVPIVQLTKNVFTYRVYPDATNTSVYYDIIHTKTHHAEPGTSHTGAWDNGHAHANGHHKNQHKHGGNGQAHGHQHAANGR